MEDWDFGIVARDRTPKPAHAVLGNRYKRGTGIQSFTDHSPKVSVIVCTYNGTRTLKECLESLVALDYGSYEVLVVDDGSTADIEGIAKEFRKFATSVRSTLA